MAFADMQKLYLSGERIMAHGPLVKKGRTLPSVPGPLRIYCTSRLKGWFVHALSGESVLVDISNMSVDIIRKDNSNDE